MVWNPTLRERLERYSSARLRDYLKNGLRKQTRQMAYAILVARRRR